MDMILRSERIGDQLPDFCATKINKGVEFQRLVIVIYTYSAEDDCRCVVHIFQISCSSTIGRDRHTRHDESFWPCHPFVHA